MSKMKRLVLGLILFGLISVKYGQYGALVEYKKTTWAELKTSKLYVVYEDDGNSNYDKALKEAIVSNWTFSEVEYINYDKYEEIQKDESNFFLLSVDFTKTESGRYNQELSYLYLIRGYKKGAKKGDISNFPRLATLQTGESNREAYITLLIKHLDLSINQVMSGKIKSLGDNTKQLNANRSKIKSKMLYVLDTDLNSKVKSISDIKSGYVGKISVVSKEELSKHIKAGEDVNVFFCARSSAKSFVPRVASSKAAGSEPP